MEMRPHPEIIQAMLREPLSWSANQREKVSQYLDELDETDQTHKEYTQLLRKWDVVLKGPKNDIWSEVAAQVNQAETKWKDAKADSSASLRELGDLSAVMTELNAATKKGREALREKLKPIERTPEVPQPEDEEIVIEEDEPSEPPHHERSKSVVELTEKMIEARFAEPIPQEVIPAPEPKVPHYIELGNAARASGQAKENKIEPKSGILRRMAKSKVAKTMYALAAVLGLSTKAASAVETFKSEQEKREYAAQQISETAGRTAFELGQQYEVIPLNNLPSPDDMIAFEDGEWIQRSEFIGKINSWYTETVKSSGGPMGLMSEQCETTLPSGEEGLDALKCNAIYGDQMKMNQQGLAVLAEVHGYSVDELEAYGKIMRNSIMQRPSSIVMPGSFVGMAYFDYGSVPESYKADREQIYDRYYDDASTMALNAVKALEIEPDDKQKIAAVQAAIQAEIRLENTTLLIAGDLQNMSNTMTAQALMEGMTDRYTGERFDADIDRLHAAADEADLAWKTVAAYEGQTGSIHEFSKAMAEVHHVKLDTLLRHGRDLNEEHRDFFVKELLRLEPQQPTTVASR